MVGVDAKWFANALAQAAVPEEFRQSSSVAVDGTDVETWGALHGDAVTVDLDGEAADTQLMDDGGGAQTEEAGPQSQGPRRRADGRNQYTADRDARAGHRSATNSRPAGPYVGYELHLAVQARDVQVDQLHRQGEPVRRGARGHHLPGAWSPPGPIGVGRSSMTWSRPSRPGHPSTMWFGIPATASARPGTTHHKLAQAGIHQTFQPVTHQRGVRPFSGDAVLLDGQLYSNLLPNELRDLPMPPRGAPEPVKVEHEAKFNLRARWRMVRHAGPDGDGATRWRCPFCAGLLRSRQFPKTMRRAKTVPLVPVDEGCEQCCDGILTAMAAELPWWQRIPFGTTAWRLSMGRRQVVESVNAALKGTFADLSRGFFRVFGQTKMTILLGFTVAGYNLDRIRSYRAKQRAQQEAKPAQPKRRRGTWQDIVEPTAAAATGADESPPT